LRVLIVGEAGETPWADSQSARRLYGWFGVATRRELQRIAVLENVSRVKGDKTILTEHLLALRAMCELADIVFLVGKASQVALSGVKTRELYWRRGKYVGLPHPSGLNRQLNEASELAISEFIFGCLREVSDDASYSTGHGVLRGADPVHGADRAPA
jgi:hypothetical protein